MTSAPPHVLIAGAGHAGGRVVQHLAQLGFKGRVTLVGEEAHRPYERPALSKDYLLQSKAFEELLVVPDEAWTHPDVTIVHRQDRMVGLDAGLRVALMKSGEALTFDHFVLATGAAPRRLPTELGAHASVHVLRTRDDADGLRAVLKPDTRLVIIGAGVIGLEVAATARAMGVASVSVIESGSRSMARCVPEAVSGWLEDLHNGHGVQFYFDHSVTGLSEAAVMITELSGKAHTLDADVVLVAIGVVPDTEALSGSDLRVADGVHTDAFCRLALDAPLYAVGDVANTFNPFFGRPLRQETWRNAENQARAVAEYIMGRAEPFVELPWMWSDQFGRNIQIVGLPMEGDEEIRRGDPNLGPAVYLYVRDGQLTGAVLINAGKERRYIERLILNRVAVTSTQLADATVSLKTVA